MRRLASAVLFVLAFAAAASAEDIRIEIGLGGVFPAGGWANCRISGLKDTPDGSEVVVTVSDMFERTLAVKDGAAEGLILMPDESPAIRLSVPGKGRVELPPGALSRLRGIKDKLPVLFIGDNAPDAARVQEVLGAGDIFPIRMTAQEFLSRRLDDFDWVHAFAIGTLAPGESDGCKRFFDHFSKSTIVVRVNALGHTIERETWSQAGTDTCLYNSKLAPFLPVPRGSVRPELYEIFGPPVWPESGRQHLALAFGAVLVVTALHAVRPLKRLRGWPGTAVYAGALLLLMLVARWTWSPAPAVETASLAQAAWNGRTCVQTDLYSRAFLTPGEKPADWPLKEFTPAASYPGQWVERRLVMDETGRLSREAPVPSREVVISHWYGPPAETVAEEFRTNGRQVWTDGIDLKKSAKWPFQKPEMAVTFETRSQLFSEFLAERRHPDARVDELRSAMLRYWRRFCFREGKLYTFGWVEGYGGPHALSAGTLVVIEYPDIIEVAY